MGSRVVGRILRVHPSVEVIGVVGMKRGPRCAREGDGEDNNPGGIVCVEPHHVLPSVVVPDDIIGGGWKTQGFKNGFDKKQGVGVEEVARVRVGPDVMGGDVRSAFYDNGAGHRHRCGRDVEELLI